MVILQTNDLRKSFTTQQGTVEAVRGVNMRVEAGSIFGFLGPNGAGKTTTLRMLTTLLPPSAGEAQVVGFDLSREPLEIRKRIGYVSQAGGADENATGRSDLILQARLYGLSKAQAATRAEALITALELESFADRVVRTYSGGQRRRLDLALGMVHEPVLLFLDEPTTGLDPQSRARLWDEVRRLRDQGTTVFLTTHYLDEADALCDRLAIMDHGQIVAEGTPQDLKREIAGDVITIGLDSQPDSMERALPILLAQPFVRELDQYGDSILLYADHGDEAIPKILRALDGIGVSASKITLAQPTLDDVFLRKTGRSLRETGEREQIVGGSEQVVAG